MPREEVLVHSLATPPRPSFARVRTRRGGLEEREIQVGVSDGIKIEITSGLHAGDQVAAYDAP